MKMKMRSENDEVKEEEELTINISERLKWDPAVDHFHYIVVGSSYVPRSGKNALGFEALESIEVKPWIGH